MRLNPSATLIVSKLTVMTCWGGGSLVLEP
jgi:hypothetical protein